VISLFKVLNPRTVTVFRVGEIDVIPVPITPQFFAKVTFLMKKPNLSLKDNGRFS
jgi:hypothetical protein